MFISDQKCFQERDAGGRYAWRACSRGRLTSCLKIRAVGTWVCVSVAASKGLLSSGDRGLPLGKTESLTTGPLCNPGVFTSGFKQSAANTVPNCSCWASHGACGHTAVHGGLSFLAVPPALRAALGACTANGDSGFYFLLRISFPRRISTQ